MLKDRLIELSSGLPARFEEQRDGTLKLEFKVAERKVFLSKKTLNYKAHLRLDDDNKTVRFFETLKETGLGISSGDSDITPGLGFKVETYKVTGKEREGNIEELSKLFGKDYKYSFDWSRIREMVKREADNSGYSFQTVLNEKHI
ncbi:MAG: ribonucleoside-triphosphate reductase [Candidatus Bathyarchaeia archaeon]|nr:ribonucleoside-triphosphate reductase [Candidatus Bathyarchaeota archaeon]